MYYELRDCESEEIDEAVAEERERQRASDRSQRYSTMNTSSTALLTKEEELSEALRPFSSTGTVQTASAVEKKKTHAMKDFLSTKKHSQMQEFIENGERGTCVACGPIGVFACAFDDGTVRIARAQQDDSQGVCGSQRILPAISRDYEANNVQQQQQQQQQEHEKSISSSNTSFLKVTALSFGNGGEWLVSGYDDASIVLWDVKRCSQLKRVKSPITTTTSTTATTIQNNYKEIDSSMVVSIIAVNQIPNSSSQCEVIVALKSGQVLRHEFSWFGPLLRNRTTSLGEKTFVIGGDALPAKSFAVKPPIAGTVPWFWGDEKLKEQTDAEEDLNNSALLDSTFAGSSSVNPRLSIGGGTNNISGASSTLLSEFTKDKSAANSAGLVCLTTASACLIMRLYPDAEVVTKIPRPKDVDVSKVPYARFRPKVVYNCISSIDNNDSNINSQSNNRGGIESNEGDLETREVAVVWGNRVTIWELGILSPEKVIKANRELQKQKVEMQQQITPPGNKTPSPSSKGQSGGRVIPKLLLEWKLPENVAKDSDGCALFWFGDEVLGVICGERVATLLAFHASTGELLERVALDAHPTTVLLPIPSRDASSKQQVVSPSSNAPQASIWSSHVSCGNRGAGAVILSAASIRVCKILGWRERVNSHRKRSDWGGAFAIAVAAYKESFGKINKKAGNEDDIIPSNSSSSDLDSYLVGIPSDARERIVRESLLPASSMKFEREAAREVCLKLLPQFLKDAMMVVQATSGQDDQAHVHAESVARATLAVCLAVDSLDKMYDQSIYDPLMEATHGKEAFIERIVPHVLNDELQSLPPEVMQSLVTHFASKGEHGIIERCVLRMDVTSLDVNQVARLCETHGMFAAHASVFVRAFEDFSSPAFAMFEHTLKMIKLLEVEVASDDDKAAVAYSQKAAVSDGNIKEEEEEGEAVKFESSRKSARRLLLFSRESIAGRLFPPRFSEDMTVHKQNEAAQDPRRAEKARFDLMRFLLSPETVKSVREVAAKIASSQENYTAKTQNSDADAFRQFWRGVDSLRKKRFNNTNAQPVDAMLTSSQIRENGNVAGRSGCSDAPDRLLFLFSIEPAATTTFLKDALDSWDASERELFEDANNLNRTTDRMAAQVVCDAALFAAESIEEETTFAAEETLNRRLLEIKITLLTFAAALVGTGRVSVDREREFALIEALTFGPAKTLRERSDAACLIVAQTVDDLTRRHRGANDTSAALSKYAQSKVFVLLSEANFAQAMTVLHLAEGDYGAALETLAAKDVLIRPNSAGYFADVLLGCAPAGIQAAKENDAGPAVGRARALPAGELREQFKKSLLQSAPKIAEVNAGIVARLGVAHFPDQQEAVLNALSSNPLFQFWYLREVLAGKSVVDLDATQESDHDHQTLARLIERSGVKVTEEMSELYVKLMCQFEPSNVLPFLKSRAGGFRLDACLEQCQIHGVVDASAHILEIMGRVCDALELHVQKYEQNIEALANLHNKKTTTPGKIPLNSATKMSKDVSRGFALESSESLDAATALCLRCDRRNFIESEFMWHRLLDCVISARIAYGSAAQFVDQTLREHVERILHDTLERVAPEKVLSDVLKTRGNETLRELRRVLTGILETVEREKVSVRKDERASEHKVLRASLDKIQALGRGRRSENVRLIVRQVVKQSPQKSKQNKRRAVQQQSTPNSSSSKIRQNSTRSQRI